jgi:hypothetical protein
LTPSPHTALQRPNLANTRRGHAVYAREVEILRGIERDWTSELGLRDLAQLKKLLGRVWESPLVG